MKPIILLTFLLVYCLLAVPVKKHLENRPLAIKLGVTPNAEIVKTLTADHAYLMAEWSMLRVLFYFGALVEQWKNKIFLPPEYYNMFKTVETAIKLDPYNADAYYFAQAAFTWEVGRAADVNRLLEYGMQYRDWDANLPFYAGFNAGFFLNDYEKAARYMRRAADLSGMAFYGKLASRYFYEAGQNELGIAFLETMANQSTDATEKKIYELRIKALQGANALEKSVQEYQEQFGTVPEQLSELIDAGVIQSIPEDPYGGRYFLDEAGRVRTTSNFAFAGRKE